MPRLIARSWTIVAFRRMPQRSRLTARRTSQRRCRRQSRTLVYGSKRDSPPLFQLADLRQKGVALRGEPSPSVLEALQHNHVALIHDVLAQAVRVCATGLRALRTHIVLRVAG